ncbi:hypothetical protein [Streptomyces sp. WM6368]|uniref:hypothetical protein n=1 Tax=Streptomyces sp. WM6368 TaxID=1415554 RepID=UPI0006AE4078|nr:hypothetical protein [Streptomyces sp. WM6368]KOU37183.1 hypothetical protein ADK51_00830 [Streptomyces sp. WM6368]
MFVNSFIGDYNDGVRNEHREGKNSFEVREEFFTKKFYDDSLKWDEQHQDSNIVFRRKDLPEGWAVDHDSATEETEKVLATYQFEDKTKTKVMFYVSVKEKLIFDIQDVAS